MYTYKHAKSVKLFWKHAQFVDDTQERRQLPSFVERRQQRQKYHPHQALAETGNVAIVVVVVVIVIIILFLLFTIVIIISKKLPILRRINDNSNTDAADDYVVGLHMSWVVGLLDGCLWERGVVMSDWEGEF